MTQWVAADERPDTVPGWVRPGLTFLALLLIMLALLPPVSTEAHRYEYVEALQFSLFALVIPALFALGAPWRFLKLANDVEEHNAAGQSTDRPMDCLAHGRLRHREFGRVVIFLVPALATMVAWRTPAAVDLLEHDSGVVVLEAVSLIAAGIGLWLECVSSFPLVPRSTRPVRIAICAVSMWTIWIVGYLIGFSHAPWYRSFHHVAGQTLSLGADQQLTTGVLCFFAASVFVPVIFFNLVAWLHSEDNPDEELHALLREERRREPGPIRRDGNRQRSNPPSGTS